MNAKGACYWHTKKKLFPYKFSPHTSQKFKNYIISFHTHKKSSFYPSPHFPLSSYTHLLSFLSTHRSNSQRPSPLRTASVTSASFTTCPASLSLRRSSTPSPLPFQRYHCHFIFLHHLFFTIFSILDNLFFS